MISNSEENSQQNLNDEVAGASGDVVANFVASGPDDPKLAGGFDLSEDEIAEIVAYDEQRPPSRHKATFDAWREKHRVDIERNQRSGHIAQVMNEIDEHRKTPDGRADYNANRRKKRHKDAEAEGRTVKARNRNPTKEDRAAQQQAYKDRKKAEFALMSPDEQQAVRKAESQKRQGRRDAEKARTKKALADKAIF